MVYIAILRGINVGGKRKILMADLRALFLEMGFKNISTYIQSGNVFFESILEPNEKEISTAIKNTFGFEVPVIIISAEAIKELVKLNPYREQPIEKLHVTFLSKSADAALIKSIQVLDFSPNQFSIKNKYVFLCLASKYHTSKLSNNFFEKKLQVTASTRNWKTVLKLIELSSN